MIEMTSEALLDFYREQGLEATADRETGQVLFNLSYEQTQCPVFVRIYPEGQLLQLMMFFPMMMQPKSQGDTARLLHFFNKELDIPGFGMDETAGVCFFRCMIPTNEQKISKEILRGYLDTLRTVCQNFFSSIGVITTRAMTFEALMEKAQQRLKQGTK